MKKRSPARPEKRTELPPLSGIQQQVMSYLLNNVAFDDYGDCCSVEAIADRLHRTPGGVMRTLRKLAEMGYIEFAGEMFPWVYPRPQPCAKPTPRSPSSKRSRF